MRICHITAHLPPDQAASALLPAHLGQWAREAGDQPCYVAHPPRAMGGRGPTALAAHAATLPGPVAWVPARTATGALSRALRLGSIVEARFIFGVAAPVIRDADVVHIHSNGLLPEVAAWIARRAGKPVVLTLYGTEIWHYRPKWPGPDLFTRAYRHADRVTFYSQGLLDRARQVGLDRPGLRVVYPPVAPYFVRADRTAQDAAKARLGITERYLLVNVKRLHPLAGQIHLLRAMPVVLAEFPDTRLVFCGSGPLGEELERTAAALGIAACITFAGLVENRLISSYYAAADAFVLPSQLEACPTVAIEALACGTPVVSTDNPGGVELAALFAPDVTVVPRENPGALADAIAGVLRHPRRTRLETSTVINREFSPAVVAARFSAIYREVLNAHA
jgi:glycosyltransferase involved in cell wall biosynthesis